MVGTFYLKPDSLRLGAHVANAGYVGACRRPSGWQRNGFEVVGTLPCLLYTSPSPRDRG